MATTSPAQPCSLSERWNLPGMSNPPLLHVRQCAACRRVLCFEIQRLLTNSVAIILAATNGFGLIGSVALLMYYRQILSVLHQLNYAIFAEKNFTVIGPLSPLLLDPVRPALREFTDEELTDIADATSPGWTASAITGADRVNARRIALVYEHKVVIARRVRMIAANIYPPDEISTYETLWNFTIGTSEIILTPEL